MLEEKLREKNTKLSKLELDNLIKIEKQNFGIKKRNYPKRMQEEKLSLAKKKKSSI